MGDLNPKVAAGGQGSFDFKCPFSHLLISIVFHTFLKIKTSNKKHTLKNESIYSLRKLQENPPTFMQLSWSFFYFVSFSLQASFSRFILFKYLLL
jgi:hypothetical protein